MKFRNQALNKLQSPERLDLLLTFPYTREWLLTLTILIIFIGIFIWSITGSIPVVINGHGVMVNSSGFNEIRSGFDGRIDTLSINVGDSVKKGQLLASVEQLDQALNIQKLERSLEGYKKKRKQLLQQSDENLRKNYINGLNTRLKSINHQLYASQDSLKNSQTSVDSTFWRSQLAFFNEQRDKLEFELYELAHLNPEMIFQLQDQISQLENDLTLAKSNLNFTTRIVSPHEGIITEIMIDNGDILHPNAPIMTIENTGSDLNDLVTLIYVNAQKGKLIEPGMELHIEPTTIESEKYGYIEGVVTYVSKYPATRPGMLKRLRNEELVDNLAEEGLPLLVEARLKTDPNTVSGYKWTTSKGPNTAIVGGLLTNARIILEEKKPISYVFPSI